MIIIDQLNNIDYTISMFKKLIFSWIGFGILSVLIGGGVLVGMQLTNNSVFASEQETFLKQFNTQVKTLKYDNIKPYLDEEKLFVNLEGTYKNKFNLGILEQFLSEGVKSNIKQELKKYVINEYESGKLLPSDLDTSKSKIDIKDKKIEVSIPSSKGEYKLYFEKNEGWKLYNIVTPL
jgi:hypothetical protein